MNLFCVWGIYNFCHKRMVTNLLVDLTLLTYTLNFFYKVTFQYVILDIFQGNLRFEFFKVLLSGVTNAQKHTPRSWLGAG